MQKIVVAIDGYSGCGKSSTAKAVAKELGYTYIDSGAMYRAATLYLLDQGLSFENLPTIEESLKNVDISFKHDYQAGRQCTFLNSVNVEDEIRTMRVSEMVSEISKIRAVRTELVAQQQRMGKEKGVVMDGRDIGTVVFPAAELKVFMTADLAIRAERRQKELIEKGQPVDFETIIRNLSERDRIDTTRSESPLRKAVDALELDTSDLKFDEQVDIIVKWAIERIGQ